MCGTALPVDVLLDPSSPVEFGVSPTMSSTTQHIEVCSLLYSSLPTLSHSHEGCSCTCMRKSNNSRKSRKGACFSLYSRSQKNRFKKVHCSTAEESFQKYSIYCTSTVCLCAESKTKDASTLVLDKCLNLSWPREMVKPVHLCYVRFHMCLYVYTCAPF